MSIIKSISYTDQEILQAILTLYVKDDRFDLDPCYSKGVFYKGMNEPRLKYDISPQIEGVIKADVKDIVLNERIKSIVFDPPFLFHMRGSYSIRDRFSGFKNFNELEDMYRKALKRFYDMLDKGGIVAFKCQDFTDTKTTLTHCFVWRWAEEQGFYVKDIFIKIAKQRLILQKKQRHARKFHSYWLVLEKVK